MSPRPHNHEALAELLRERPPIPDDIARARMEKSFVEAAGSRVLPARQRRWPRALLGAGVLAAAAAIGIVLFVDDPPATRVARIERRQTSADVSRGTLDEGSTIVTSAGEVADLRIEESHVRIAEASRVRMTALAPDRIELELDRGMIDVAFHPRARGHEGMTISTPHVRVEVVGTVFRVSVGEGATDVFVREGTVRVVPREGGAPELVRAGQRTSVTRAPPIVVPAAPEASVPSEQESAPPAEPAEQDEDPRARLEEARRLIEAGRTSAAEALLRRLTQPWVAAGVRAEAFTLRADMHLASAQHDEAAREYEEAAQAGRGRPVGHNAIYALARLSERHLGDRDAARASYERYLSEAPDGALAAQARRALCRLGSSEHCEADP